jgi:hypothetical protein
MVVRFQNRAEWGATLAGLALIVSAFLASAASAAEAPASYCRRVVTDDKLRPIPSSLVSATQRVFGLTAAPAEFVRRTTVFRCAEGAVLVCVVGANLPCGKADTRRSLPAADRFCRENPRTPFIPAVVTGHATIYSWRCQGALAAPGAPVQSTDARGFNARLWKSVQ